MKKENRKLAQQRKAAEKKKQARKTILNTIFKYGVPSLLLIALVIFCLVNPFAKDESGSSSENSDTSASTESEVSDTYSTDSSLTIKDGDTVNIDYVGSIDGVEFSGGNTQGAGADLTIGSNSYIDDFEEQLIGAHPGDEVDVNVTFPEDYHQADLAGKDALFKVVVNGIYE